MKKTTLAILVLVTAPAFLVCQTGSINNTLGTGGSFTVKDGSTTFLSLGQANGYLNLNKSLTLPVATDSTVGVIFKGTDRFIHDYKAPSTDGHNTFVGVNSGNFTMSGISGQSSYNTSVGHSSLTSLSMAGGNCAFGYQSLSSNTMGNTNSAFGYVSLSSNVDGFQNSAFGGQSLLFTTGTNNSAFGFAAGTNVTTGSNNTLIGYNAEPSSAAVSNEITLGDANILALRCHVTSITALSDARDKKNIKDLPLGLEFLMNIKPRQFNWDRREWYEDGNADGSKMKEQPTAGFIAQELDEVQTKEGAEWLNLVLKSNPDRLEATPGNLLPIMVKAIQELKSENDGLRNEVEKLRASIAEQVKKEVRSVLVKAVQEEDARTKVSFNETKH